MPLPFARDADGGLAVLTNPEQGEMWHEPYSGKNYYWQRAVDLNLTRRANIVSAYGSPAAR